MGDNIWLYYIRAERNIDVLQNDAQEILKETGVQGGLIVHIGCSNGKLTAALRASDKYLSKVRKRKPGVSGMSMNTFIRWE